MRPDVQWKLYASPDINNITDIYRKKSIQNLWYDYADPSKYLTIDREVENYSVDEKRLTATLLIKEERVTHDDETHFLFGTLFLVFDVHGGVKTVDNFIYES